MCSFSPEEYLMEAARRLLPKTSAMKTFKSIPLILFIFLACQREESLLPPAPEPQLVEHTLYASTPGEDAPQTRTIISPYNDEKILWSAQERISILSGGGNYPFQGNNDIIESSASFTGEAPANLGNYIALYPYDASASYDGTYVSTTLPAVQTGRVNTFADGYLVTADDATGSSISFNHLCSGIRFEVNTNNIKAVSLRGNNGEKIAGDFRFRFASKDTPVAEAGTEESVTLKAPGGSFEEWAYYYIVILPTTFTKGFTLIADNGTQIGEYRIDSEVTFSPGVFKRVTGQLNDRITTWKGAMAYYGPENSFCLRPGGSVSFDVTPRLIEDAWQRGPVPAVADVPDGTQVLWGNSTASLSGTTLTLTAAATEGSSLVAIKKGETILWSYLIWVTESAPAETALPGGVMMQPALGGNCYFQWGRKDPLLSSTERVANPESGCLAYSISHPAEYIKRNSNNYDWINDVDWTLWGDGAAKTVWDPCPAGYRVPAKDDYSAMTESFLTSTFEALGYISDNGYRNYTDYRYWTRSAAIQGNVRKLSWCLSWPPDTAEPDLLLTDNRNMAYPVRCVKE